jgi:hypothetical protein
MVLSAQRPTHSTWSSTVQPGSPHHGHSRKSASLLRLMTLDQDPWKVDTPSDTDCPVQKTAQAVSQHNPAHVFAVMYRRMHFNVIPDPETMLWGGDRGGIRLSTLWMGKKIFSPVKRPHISPNSVWGNSPRRWSVRGVNQATDLHLLPRLSMSGAAPPYALMAWCLSSKESSTYTSIYTYVSLTTFLTGFHYKAFLIFAPMRPTCPTHLTDLDFSTLIMMCGRAYEWRSY